MFEPDVCEQRGNACRRQTRSRPATPSGDRDPEIPTSNVRVVCRIRPMNEREKKAGATPAATASTERKEVAVVRIFAGGTRQVRSTFHFDDVLTSFSSQEDVFRSTLQPLVGQVLAGYETTAFAYGQTGTGKTYTMEGQLDSSEGRGLVPRTAAAVLEALAGAEFTESTVTVSYLEIYNEELSDLLSTAERHPKLDLKDVGGGRGVLCQGLSEVEVHSMQDILEVVRRAQEKRRVAETRVNARSSRSHSIFTMKVRCRRAVAGGELENLGKLHLVDLAGSECAKKGYLYPDAQAQDPSFARVMAGEEERERRNINQSLLSLGRVITALREGSGRVPYRDSKLTRLLQDALGGRCKTVIIATISPALAAVEETISALQYAEQAAGIKNRPVASSLLRTATVASAARTVHDVSSSSGLGASDWAELEMKVTYLSQELEEAQVALGRKYQEAQEEADRAMKAEARLEQLAQELRKAQLSCEEQSFAKERFASLAAGRHEAAVGLKSVLKAADEHRLQLEQRISLATEQIRTSQSHREEKCRTIEHDIHAKLQQLLPAPPSEVREQAQEVSIAASPAETESMILETSSVHKAALASLSEEQQRQRQCVAGLAERVRRQRAETHGALADLSGAARDDLAQSAAQAATTLGAAEAALRSAAAAAQGGSAACEALRAAVATQKAALSAAAERAAAALAAASAAVGELSGISDTSLTSAMEAITSLEDMQNEVLSQIKQEASESADKVQDEASSGSKALESHRSHALEAEEQARKSWDSVGEVLCRHAGEEDAMIQEAETTSERVEQAASEQVANCTAKTTNTQGRALGGVQALRQGAESALQQQMSEVNSFVESTKACILDEPLEPYRAEIPQVCLPPLPSEDQILAEFQSSRLPMSAGLVQTVSAALRSAKQTLNAVQLTAVQEAMQLLDTPLEDKPKWGAAQARGLFLVFEGLDRSGKSTQSKKLEAHLQKVGYGKVKWMCFPNRKTAIGTAIDLYLRRQLELPDEAVHRLFSANRWEMAKSIVEDLKAGTTIICDRYAFSGVAYSAAKGLDFTWCQSPDRGLPCPDGIFFLYIDEKVGASRANFGDERYENAEMQAEVRNQFKDPRLRAQVNWHDVDGARDKEAIHAEILRAFEAIRQEDQENRHPVQRLWVK
ncbi:unnamed protein product [Effrenium voratum]|uniref:Thymidylate kinase n=1 Tax=Effrenium voratum TaxID=2562239 RepID=A0AA36HUY8_9DINO|nr:unnamed protein product [Effrenium voratum]